MKNNNAALDIFDEVESEDPFNEVETTEELSIDSIKAQLGKVLDQVDSKERKKEKREITDELKEFIRAEIAKIKPTQNVIERTVQTKVIEPKVFHVEPKVVEAPPQIIKEVRVEVQTEKKDTTRYVEESKYLDLLVRFSKLEAKLKETARMAESPIVMPGGSGVIGIPPPEPSPVGYVLTVNDRKKAEWKAATAGGASISGYTVSDPTTLKTLPLNASLDDLRQVLGTLLTELQA